MHYTKGFQFVWKKKQQEKIHLQLEPTIIDSEETVKIERKGHWTTLLLEDFLQAMPFILHPNIEITCCKVFSILFITAWIFFCKALIDFNTSRTQSVAHRHVYILENNIKWSQTQTTNLIFQETTMALLKIIINTYNAKNPLKKLEDVIWEYW